MEKPKRKTEALLQAKNALKDYLQKHKLNPTKDWREDPIHGKEVTRLVTRLNIERDKVLDKYPYNDINNETKIVKMKDKKAKADKKAKEAKKVAAVKEIPAKKETKRNVTSKYDYPLVDGREMTAAEKKKYRAAQRAKNNPKPAKEKKVKEAPAAAPAKEKKAKKVAPVAEPAKPVKKAKDKKKKVKKEED